MRRPARRQLVGAHHAMHKDVAADAHDKTPCTVGDDEVVIGDAAGKHHRLDGPRPDRELSDPRARRVSRLVNSQSSISVLVGMTVVRRSEAAFSTALTLVLWLAQPPNLRS